MLHAMAAILTSEGIRNGTRGRFCNVVDLVNRLGTGTGGAKQGRLADYMTRLDFIILDEPGWLPFAQSGGQLPVHLISRLDDRAARSTHPPLRDRRDWQRVLALQEPRLTIRA